MRRFALFALLHCFSLLAFCQSTAITERSTQGQLDKSSKIALDFDSGLSRFVPSSAKSRDADSCHVKNPNQSQRSAQSDANQLFHVPCFNANTFSEMAHLYFPTYPRFEGQIPNAELESIPTQWPEAKVEPIPTTWPSLKMLEIEGHNPTSLLAK
jgi:hypothetical protein